jgi:hypothetical protein
MVLECLSFPDGLLGVFIIAKRNEFGVSQMVGTSPFQKCYLSRSLRPQPDVLFHLLCGKTGSPSAIGKFRKICEGAIAVLRCLIFSNTARRVAGTRPARTLFMKSH